MSSPISVPDLHRARLRDAAGVLIGEPVDERDVGLPVPVEVAHECVCGLQVRHRTDGSADRLALGEGTVSVADPELES